MKYTEEIVFKAANDAYKNGDVQFDIKTDKCALIVIDMQEPELKVLRKGFAKVMDLNRIIESLK